MKIEVDGHRPSSYSARWTERSSNARRAAPSKISSVALTWTGLPCETGHQLLIQPDGRSMTLFRTTCQGDTFPRDLVLELTFDGPVDPADLDITLETVVL